MVRVNGKSVNNKPIRLSISHKDGLACQHAVLTAFSCLFALLTMQTIGLPAADGSCLNASAKFGRIAGVMPPAGSHLTRHFSQVAWVYRQFLIQSGNGRLAAQSPLVRCTSYYYGRTAADLPTILNHRQASVLFAMGLVAAPWPWHGTGFSKFAQYCVKFPSNRDAFACRQATSQLISAQPIIFRTTTFIRSRSQLAPPKST